MVPKSNDNVVFEIYVSTNTHADDSGAADTGDDLQMTLYPYATSTSTNTFNAVGEGSGATSDADDSGVIAAAVSTNHGYVFKTTPTVTVADTSTDIVYGAESEVFRFTVAAGSNGDLSLLGLKFDVSSSGILTGSTGLGGVDAEDILAAVTDGAANAWKAYEVVSGSVDSSIQVGSGAYIHGTTANSGANVVYMDINDSITTAGYSSSFEKVSAGSSKTYQIVAPVVDDGTLNTNTISVRIASDSAEVNSATFTGGYGSTRVDNLTSVASTGSSAFTWSDRPNASGFGIGGSAYFWNNGYKVSGIPTSYVTST